MKKHRPWVRAIEITLLTMAVLLLGTYAAATVDRWISGWKALREFDLARAKVAERDAKVDFARWSVKRIRAYTESLSHPFRVPMAVLDVPKFNIRVPVIEGTDELALNRGVGWIPGTARPGQTGNVGIAGHRDGFFRALKDIREGDEIRLETLKGLIRYQVNQLEIVTPNDVAVLRERQTDSLTLVTCYPFYFMGDAPQRFIVHALRQRN
jgi:sortase A